METINYTTLDNVRIVGNWSPSPTTIGVAILLHMMPLDRKSWSAFQEVLGRHNIASLAIDMRGHGESNKTVEGVSLDYKKFSDEEHHKYLYDVIGALNWLEEKGYAKSQIMMVGASIGANIAIWALEEEPILTGAVLMSPGDYRGINAAEKAEYTKAHHAIWAAGSDSDDPDAYEMAQEVVEKSASDRKKFVPYKNAGHGIHLFTADPELMENLATWMEESYGRV
ncbi:alpha/beta hydrolase fold domain-containing protein [Candidatus Uhrbacteria bacterium]|nr:alpha/beta hydrolase fold domain-containing protein [Candidatus Uhrbacteria bacterium]